MSALEAVWPVANDRWVHDDATWTVTEDLIDMLEDEGHAAAGQPSFSRTANHLAARIPAVRDLVGDDPQPWESREAWADNDLDVPEFVYWAAYGRAAA